MIEDERKRLVPRDGGLRPLEGVDLTPSMVANAERANLFPEQVREIKEELRASLAGAALELVASTERFNCPEPALLSVERAAVDDVWGRAGLLIARRFADEPVLVGSETWTVSRCDKEPRRYRVHFFRGGDQFWARHIPLSAGGVVDLCKVAVYRRLVGQA